MQATQPIGPFRETPLVEEQPKFRNMNNTVKKLRSQQSSQHHDYDTFNGDSAGFADPSRQIEVDMQDL